MSSTGADTMEPLDIQPSADIRRAVDAQRLIDTATRLVDAPSPTLSAGPAADALAEILAEDGFTVARPVANWPESPAVAVYLDSGKPGRTLQFDGHLDTVHLPFVAARVEDGYLYGSGSADMKGGIAAEVEALRVLRDLNALPAGRVLLTAHDHHEGPWGDRRQLRALVETGTVGDAVLLPEYLADRLPVAGRGMAIFNITFRRDGEPMHEVLRPEGLPDVVAAGTSMAQRLYELSAEVSQITLPHAGHDSFFVGSIHAGEIYNQSPTLCTVQGTRRWVTPGSVELITGQLEALVAEMAAATGTDIELELEIQADAFQIDADMPVATAFQAAHRAVTGAELSPGGKPFVDDGHMLTSLGVPAITHGPAATGAHTLNESVAIDELVRVAQVYALTAVAFCESE